MIKGQSTNLKALLLVKSETTWAPKQIMGIADYRPSNKIEKYDR
jgi:hypothetical protein